MMVSGNLLKKKVYELNSEAEEIQRLGIEVLEAAEYDDEYFRRPNYKTPEGYLQRETVQRYQRWYATSHRLVEEYIPEWLDAFKAHFKSNMYGDCEVLDYLTLNTLTGYKYKDGAVSDFINGFDRQISILLSIPGTVEIKELNLRKLISADVARTEIEQAEVLFASGFHRASGSIAGVALELHLKTLCDINNVEYKPKDTIEPLAQALYKAKILDVIELKRFQYLGSIRNKCSHPGDITEAEVQTLIEGVKKIV